MKKGKENDKEICKFQISQMGFYLNKEIEEKKKIEKGNENGKRKKLTRLNLSLSFMFNDVAYQEQLILSLIRWLLIYPITELSN